MFPSSVGTGETPTLLGPLERANLNHWTTHVQVKVALGLAVYHQSVRLDARPLESVHFAHVTC
jgi:hypothetical protein